MQVIKQFLISRLACRGVLLACIGSGLSAAETPPAPPAPSVPPVSPTETPATSTPERPRIHYWLDDNATPPTGAKPAPIAAEPRAEGETAPAPVPLPPPLPAPLGPICVDPVEHAPVPTKQIVGDEPLVVPPGSVDARSANAHNPEVQALVKARLKEARFAYKCKQYVRTVAICREILEADPRNLAAVELLREAQAAITAADAKIANIAGERRDREAILETEEHSVRPPPRLPTVRPHLARRGEGGEAERRKKIAERLEEPVSIDFIEADLEYVLNTLFKLTGVNIMADPAAMQGKTLTLHVENLPLREVLNFIVRNNDGIQYSITDDAVWITASDASDLKKIMFPRVYPLHHGLVSTAAGTGVATGQRSGGTGRAGTSRAGASGGGGGGGTGAGGQGQAEPSYIETVLKWVKDAKDPQMFPEGSDYLVDRQSNQLIVFTTPAGHQKISEFLDYFDQPAIQVLIKTRFLSIVAENEKSLGVNIDQLATKVGSLDATTGEATGANPFRAFTFTGGTQAINVPGNLGVGNIFSIVGRRTDPTFKVTLSALLNNRLTKILSEPQILAINNKEAIIDVTTHFSYITDLRPVTTTDAVGNGTAISNVSAFVPEFDEENIGFTLVVTPSVGRDLKTINMHLNPVIDSLAQGQQITQFQQFDVSQVNTGNNQAVPPTIQRPTIDQTSLETDVVMEDNGYVILGGLLRNQQERRERKIPGLHRIPFLGNLFKTTNTTSTKSNLMIIVEAQIITPGGRTYYKDAEGDDIDIREGGVPRAPGQVSINDNDKDSNYPSGRAMPDNVRAAWSEIARPGPNSPAPLDRDIVDDRSIHARPRQSRQPRSAPLPLPVDPAEAMREFRNYESRSNGDTPPASTGGNAAPVPATPQQPSAPQPARPEPSLSRAEVSDALDAVGPALPRDEKSAPVQPASSTPVQSVQPAQPVQPAQQTAMNQKLSARQQMEKLAQASREGEISPELKHKSRFAQDSGWGLAEEVVSEAGKAEKTEKAAPSTPQAKDARRGEVVQP